MAKITILGAGGWGMALAIGAADNGHDVTIWSPFEEEIENLRKTRSNERLLAGVTLPESIALTTDITAAGGSHITIIATPSGAVRQTARRLAEVPDIGIPVCVAKGFEKDSMLRLSQVIGQELPGKEVVALSGPSHAEEVARRVPTGIVAASSTLSYAEVVQDALRSDTLRIYTNDDIIGVELGGAVKNVIAICVGLCNGLELGDNTKAALMTRGLAEMERLGACLGARHRTFAGLSGIGDLIVTCTSRHSRNNRFGTLVGQGTDVKTALAEVGTVEGYYAAEIVHLMARKYRVELPIIEECYKVLYEGKDVRLVSGDLMRRPKRAE